MSSSLVTLRAGGREAPLFLMHDDDGDVQYLQSLVELLPAAFPIHGLRSAGLDADCEPLTSVGAMAEVYLAEVRAVQPTGPYCLGGWSLGGLIAYEMAQRLEAQGEKVGLLALFDPFCPIRSPHYPTRLACFESMVDPWAWRLERWVRGERRQTPARPRRSPLALANRAAARTYNPAPYAGPAAYFHSAEPADIQSGFRLGWSDLVLGGLEVHMVSGGHCTLFEPPHVGVLANRLTLCLERTRQASHTPPAAAAPIADCLTFPQAFERQAHACAKQPAIVGVDGALSYAQLDTRSNRIANFLTARVPERQSRVAMLMQHGATAIAAMIGIFKAGLVYAPLDPLSPAKRLQSLLRELDPAVILTDAAHLSQAGALAADSLPILNVDDGGRLEATNPRSAAAPHDLAWIIYTSGSTGKPKGVTQTHGNLLHFARAFSEALGVRAGDRMSCVFSLHFSASVLDICAALTAGATLHTHDLKTAGTAHLADWLQRHSISILHVIPSVLRHLVAGLAAGDRLHHLRAVDVAGEPLFSADVERFRRHVRPDCVVVNHLACTEASMLAYDPVRHDTVLAGSRAPVGKAIAGVRLIVMDEKGGEAPPGQVGELVVESSLLSPGYWRDEALTNGAFSTVADNPSMRRYRTGDLAQRLADGRLVHVGRGGARVKVRGYAVDIAELQAVLLSLESIRDAAVVAHEEAADTTLTAYLVARDNERLPASTLRQTLAVALPDYMIPSSLVYVDQLPRTSTGKVDLQALRQARTVSEAARRPPRAPSTPTEEWLLELWQSVLGSNWFGIDDDFYELGGNSLKAARLIERIESERARKLPMTALLTAPTVAMLAAMLEAPQTEPLWSSLVPVRPRAGHTPLFCVHDQKGSVLYMERLSNLMPEMSFYGLQSVGLEAEQRLLTTVEEMAAWYIREVRSLQPSGPYYLCGYSFGCAVALEMARQLEADGEPVALLAMLDMCCPRHSPSARVRSKFFEDFVDPMLSRLERCVAMVVDHDYSRLKKWLRERWWPELQKKIRLRLYGDIATTRQTRIGRNNGAAAARYQPRPYSGRAAFFYAAEYHHLRPDHRLDWSDVVAGGLEVHLVPGHHSIMAQEPHVRILAAKLRTCIERARLDVIERGSAIVLTSEERAAP